MTQVQNEEQVPHFYNNIDLRKFQKQSSRDKKLNRHCEHIIRNGKPITLTQEKRERFIQIICDIPENPISLNVFCGMAIYVCTAGLLPLFIFAIASGFSRSRINQEITYLLYIIGAILLLLVLAGFAGLCILITRKNKKHAERFRTETHEKIRRGDFQAYAYRIEEIYRVKTYNEDAYGGYLYFWYRVGDVLFELPNTTFAYNLGNNDEIICKNPEQMELHERNHPVGGYIIGMLIHLGGQERFYGI